MLLYNLCSSFKFIVGKRWRIQVRHCSTKQKVAGSIPDSVMVSLTESSCLTVTLVSTQPLRGMSTWNISWKYNGGRYLGLTTLPPSYVDYLEIWKPQTPGALRASPDMYWDCFIFTFTTRVYLLN